MNNITLKEAADMLRNHDNILILTHISPDGDTLGCAYALKHSLPQKKAAVVCDDKLPERLRFICEDADSLSPDTLPEDFEPGLIISVDTATAVLAGAYGKALAEKGAIDIKIDHHPMSEEFARYNYIDTDASSCGEIILDLVGYLSPLNKAAAEALYAAISSDTGSFRYSNVTPETHRKAAVLLSEGIDNADISKRLFESKTQNEMRAMRVALESLKFYRGGSVASVCFTNEMKLRNTLSDEDIGDITSIPRQIKGVELGITIKQKEDNPREFRISMRSEKTIAANALCALFGGGGHLRAAGAMIEAESGDEAERMIIGRVLAELEKQDGK